MMKRYLSIIIPVFLLITTSLFSGTKTISISEIICQLIPNNLYPSFLKNTVTNNEKVFAYYNDPLNHLDSSFINTAFFRVFSYNLINDSIQEEYKFRDFNKRGELFRNGVLNNTSDTIYSILVSKEPDTAKIYYLEISEFYTNLAGNPVKSKYKAVGNLYDGIFSKVFIRNGIFQQFYSNGSLKEIKYYNNGILSDGKHYYYFPDGKPSLIYKIFNGALHDTTVRFNNDGEIIEKYIYEHGQLIKHEQKESSTNDLHKKALIVAIGENYSDSLGHYSINIDYDVYYLNEMLKQKSFPDSNIIILKDEKATLSRISSSFDSLIYNTNEGDVVYVQFSSQSIQLELNDGSFKSILIPYDAIISKELLTDKFNPNSDILNSFIDKDYLFKKLDELRIAAGPSGQVVMTLNACSSGNNNNELKNNSNSFTAGFRSAILASEEIQSGNSKSPYIFIGPKNYAYEIPDENGNLVGNISYFLYKTVTQTPSFEFDIAKNFLKKLNNDRLSSKAEILVDGNLDIPVFESRPWLKPKEKGIIKKGNAWILSIGISDYIFPGNENISFDNCKADANSFSLFFKHQYRKLKSDKKNEYSQYNNILINEYAAKDSILEAINYIGDHAQPDDYFIFNFSGYTRSLSDNTGKKTTWFVPYGLNDITDSCEIIEKGISLTQFKNLFEFIPANNQMFITEAGQSEDFHREFVKALIESNPTISSLTGRNRIIIVPRGYGRDYFNCNFQRINNGPLNYFLTSLPVELNVFQLFETGPYREEVEYALNHIEHKCNAFSKNYFHIFYEKDFTDDLKYYLSDEIISSSRASMLQSESHKFIKEKVGSKHALIIGTNDYIGALEWSKLANPIIDAKAIESELKNGFGYNTNLLLDPPLDTIYKHLIYYASALDTTDQFILFIAGHGDFDQLLDDGMIVCSDSKHSFEDQARNSYIQYSKLTRIINNLPPKQILVILDVCFGGTFDEELARNKNRNRNASYEDLLAEDYLYRKIKYKTRIFLSSGGKNVVPDGYKGKHSPFAYKIIEALRSRGGEYGLLTASDLFQFVQKLPSEPMKNGFGNNEPGSEFLLISNTASN